MVMVGIRIISFMDTSVLGNSMPDHLVRLMYVCPIIGSEKEINQILDARVNGVGDR